MTPKTKVTEEDLKVTEALLARSFCNLKSSLTRIPGDMVKPMAGTVKEHPYASMAAAAGAGLMGYEIIRLMTPRVIVRETKVQPQVEVKEHARASLASQVMSLAAPYIVGYLQQEVVRLLVQPHQDQDTK